MRLIYRCGGPDGRARLRSVGLLVSWALLAATCGSLTGCSGHRGHDTNVVIPLPPPDQPVEKSESIDLHFYLDASASMKGFLANPRPGQANYFASIMRDANNILCTAWDGNCTFWRFGDGEPRQLEDNSIYAFTKPSAFTDQYTHIEKAIGHKAHGQEPNTGLPKVKVIVTDLMQNQNEARGLAKLLDDNYLNQEPLAVGVLGVRNAFSGKVDVPANKQEADSLPFYFLIAGKAQDVRFTIERLVRGFRIAPADHFDIVFTRQMVRHMTQEIEVASTNGGDLDDRRVPGAADRHIPVLVNVRKDVTLSVRKRVEGKPEGGKLAPEYLSSDTHLKLQIHPEVTAYRPGQTAPDARAKNAVIPDVKTPDVKTQQITIHRSLLDSNTLYLFQVDLIGDWDQAVSDMDSWDLDSPDVKFPKDAKGIREGRTLSLLNFLDVLLLKMSHHQTPLVRYYFYVQTK